ncbi:BPSL0761 family protein [Caballeronia sp. 15711]|uniref:BPSL0761 family protein n=1 Tax=Caballeronia sp. 15711 TaxID=3391029 RepID=UPI0039E3687C
MTTPAERTKAVVDTRDFLEMLTTAEKVSIRGLVQSVAIGLLRHYPLNVDLDVSASALPGVWTHPTAGRPDSVRSRRYVVRDAD